jgi:hypothetical protein
MIWVVLAAELMTTSMAYADIYTKANAMGMGEVETWISGKKRREETHVVFAGMPEQKNIVITRVDKDVEWTVDEGLQAYGR